MRTTQRNVEMKTVSPMFSVLCQFVSIKRTSPGFRVHSIKPGCCEAVSLLWLCHSNDVSSGWKVG